MTYILTRQLLGGKYSKWIVILQEFDLVFTTTKSKKSLVFAKLFCSNIINVMLLLLFLEKVLEVCEMSNISSGCSTHHQGQMKILN